MAWTYQIKNKYQDNNGLHVIVNFASETDNYDRGFTPNSLDALKNQIQNELTQLANLDSFISTIPQGQLSDLTPAPTPTPTAFQTEQLKFQADWFRWRQIKSGIDAGIIDGTNANVVAFQTKVKNEFSQIIADAQTGGATTAQAWAIALNLL